MQNNDFFHKYRAQPFLKKIVFTFEIWWEESSEWVFEKTLKFNVG